MTVDAHQSLAHQFDGLRPHLHAVAYRMLGSTSDAQDAVQESWLRLHSQHPTTIDDLRGWLTVVLGRICLDMLRRRHTRREDTLGTWLPQPLVREDTSPEDSALLADSVGLALLVVLETLNPAERLAFVLHDIFGVTYDHIATIIERTPAAARQLASRARRRVRRDTPPPADPAIQRRLVAAFLDASRNGNFTALLSVLHPDVIFRADLGPDQPATTPITGAHAVTRHLLANAPRFARYTHPILVNGTPGAMAGTLTNPISVVSFTIADNRIHTINVIADPHKLPTSRDGLSAGGESSETRDRVGSPRVGEVGRPHGRRPYGFARHYAVVGGRRRLIKQTIDEQQAAVIGEAARRVLDGEALYAIARDFNARGIPAPRGGSWDLTRVKRIVISPTVAGQCVHRGQIVGRGDWPAILDQTTWTSCQARLTDPARRPSHDHPHVKYLLTGIATCGLCSTRLKTVKNRGNRTYSCQTCYKVGIKVDTLDDYVTRLAVKRLQRTDIIERMARAAARPVDAAPAGRDHETWRKDNLDDRYAAVAAGETTRSGVEEIRSPLNRQIGAGDVATLPPVLRKVVGPDAATRWATLTIRERRELVAWLMVVIVDPTGRGKRFDPARLDHSSWRGERFTWRGHGLDIEPPDQVLDRIDPRGEPSAQPG